MNIAPEMRSGALHQLAALNAGALDLITERLLRGVQHSGILPCPTE